MMKNKFLLIIISFIILFAGYFIYNVNVIPVITYRKAKEYDTYVAQYRIRIIENEKITLNIRYSPVDTIVYLYVENEKFAYEGTIDIKFNEIDLWETYKFSEPTQTFSSTMYILDSKKFLNGLENSKNISFKLKDKKGNDAKIIVLDK